ncbi:MAG: 16S rRNA (cytidine(1402)-2'-O)-methyltransferase [Actinomycetota bacterium]|nr:16S rRNA (cytidine(1402)-2'-O)-methyltransferase [Actinomycetota bacterium]
MTATPGTLTLAGTPIGQAGDAPARLRDALGSAGLVAAEDTRRLQRLARDLGVEITGRVLSYFEANETTRTAELLDLLVAGTDVLLITDAGMPSVSDPGYRLVVAAAARGIAVTAIPGPSAVTTALAVSGLPCDRFCFEGFPPRRSAARRSAYQRLIGEARTMVFFEAPHRLAESLADMAVVFGTNRPAVVCRELTKTHEEVRRGPLGELAAWAVGGVKGEVTVVLAGAIESTVDSAPDQLAAEVARREATGEPRKQAIVDVARDAGVAKRVVYDAVVAARRG